jgi:hypothetical protein
MPVKPLPLSAFDITPEEFHRRAIWARSRGNPSWLWPDIGLEDWRAARESITRVLAEVLARGSAETALDGDPEIMSLAAYMGGIGPLLGWWIAEGRIVAADVLAEVFELHLRHNRLRMDRMRLRAVGMIQKLEQSDIPVTVLKGMHTAWTYFPDPATRPVSDIDLLVSPADADHAASIFRAEGFLLDHVSPEEKTWRAGHAPRTPRSLLLVHEDDPWTVDLHNSLNYAPRRSVPGAQLDRVVPDSPRSSWPCGAVGEVLAQPALLLHLAVHLSCSMVNLTPIRMTELALVIRRDVAAGTLLWPEFLSTARRVGALGIIYPAFHFAERLLPGTVPAEILEISASAAPRALRRHLEGLTPATAQRVGRISMTQHFMWSDGWHALGKQVLRDLRLAAATRESWNYYWNQGAQIFKPRLRS